VTWREDRRYGLRRRENGQHIDYMTNKTRRDARRAARTCINSGPSSRIVHGEVVKAGRCQRCVDVHARSR
jgi:hypothetical protein